MPSLSAELLAEFHQTKNPQDLLQRLSPKSHKKVWWQCSKGHEWEAKISDRTPPKNNGCPFCSGKKVSAEYNLETEFPKYAAEFDIERNYPLTPRNILPSSSNIVWWRCTKGHSWQNSPNARHRQAGCPVCLKRIPSAEYNLQKEFPEIAAEWDHIRNLPRLPVEVMPKAGLKAWWLCPKGHSYNSKVSNRTVNNQGCPFCTGRSVDNSNSLAVLHPELAAEWLVEKNEKKPSEVTIGSQYRAWWRCSIDSSHIWQAQVSQRVRANSNCPFCDRKSSRSEIRLYLEIRTIFPDAIHRWRVGNQEADVYLPTENIAIEYDGYYWHKNKIPADIRKGEIFASSHSIRLIRLRESPLQLLGPYDFSVQQGALKKEDVNRVLNAMLLMGIPDCSKIKSYLQDGNFIANSEFLDALKTQALPSIGRSLLEVAPEISKEYDKDLNTLPLESVSVGSSQKRWWRCTKDASHYWEATVSSRVNSETGCPYCTNRLTNVKNSLAALYPEIAKELDAQASGYTAEDLVPGSSKRVAWRCDKGHKWEAPVKRRVRDGSGCPACSGRILTTERSLAFLFPEIAKEFDVLLNRCTPDQVAAKVSTSYFWRCCKDERHIWQSGVGNRTRLGRGCPYCAGQRVLPEDSLEVVAPEIAKEFATDLNTFALQEVAPYSGRKYYWRCSIGHVWKTSAANRMAGTKCPFCRQLGLTPKK